MCEFVSWLEYKGEILFLTNKEMRSRRGKELIAHTVDKTDLVGHGSILWFYGVKRANTIQRECEDFSSPDNFPEEITNAIKSGEMSYFSVCPEGLLSGLAWAEYEKVRGLALAEYEKVRGLALAEYKKVCGLEWAEYKNVCGLALAEYEKVRGLAWAEYEKVRGLAFWEFFSDKNNRAEAWK